MPEVLVGACAAEATQAVGFLLLLVPLAAPVRTARPCHALALPAGLDVAEIWAGLGLSYAAPRLLPSFDILAVATAVYFAALLSVWPRKGAAHATTKECGNVAGAEKSTMQVGGLISNLRLCMSWPRRLLLPNAPAAS
ncbi:hypothetical protein ACFV2X_23430 [Streptomyces sp. NPDC059679]|uniref:hypothetical protein n=1 Tax=Streptomyces sp. NPDC059679 TaxID=3346903 RepID=UPI0036BAB107